MKSKQRVERGIDILLIAVIACMTAFSDIIKSNCGAQHIQYVKSQLDPNQYVTDGLVAWYDGEWNAGLGKHENNIDYWMNLMTEIPAMVISGNISFTNNALIVQKQAFSICLNCYEAVYAITNGIFTIECTGYMQELAETRFYWLNDQPNTRYSSSGITLMTHSSRALFITSRLANLLSLVSHNTDDPPCCGVGTWRIDINQQQQNSAMFYKNGSYTTRRQLTASPILTNNNLYIVANDKGPIGKFYCLRIYNRRLNEEEIHKNYLIDKERFGL